MPPVQESLDHVQALLGVSTATERHGPQEGDRLSGLRGRHVASGYKLWQLQQNALDLVSLGESHFSQPVHAKDVQRSKQWAKVVMQDDFRERREVTQQNKNELSAWNCISAASLDRRSS